MTVNNPSTFIKQLGDALNKDYLAFYISVQWFMLIDAIEQHIHMKETIYYMINRYAVFQ